MLRGKCTKPKKGRNNIMSIQKKIIVPSIIVSVIILIVSFYLILNADYQVNMVDLEKKITAQIIKDNPSKFKYTPGVTCRTINKDHKEVKITLYTDLKNCNLKCLALLAEEYNYDLWLTVPGGEMSKLKNKKIKNLYIEKNGSGIFDLSALENDKNIKTLKLIAITQLDLKNFPMLPNLTSFSLKFDSPEVFDFALLSLDKKIENLSFVNVSDFKNVKNVSELSSLGLINCSVNNIIKKIQTNLLIVSKGNIDLNILKHQKKLKKLILRQCNLNNIENLKDLKTLEELIIIDCKPDNISDSIKSLQIKKIKLR